MDDTDVPAIQRDIERHIKHSLGRTPAELSDADLFTAVALSVRDRLIDGLLETDRRHDELDPKVLNYLSIEYLIGRSLGAQLDALRVRGAYREALRRLGRELAAVEQSEPDAALGNGGLGRLAACFLDSLATLGMPAWGYGINYEYGLFRQEIDDGYQREKADNWLAQRSPWQIDRADQACIVPVYGRIEHGLDRSGGYNPMWLDWQVLIGVPHDMLIAGYGARTVQRLRLYSARSSRDFDMGIFNEGDYVKAVERKIASENVSKVLYPSDTGSGGKELRLLQEYFLVACATRDVVRRFERRHSDFSDFPRKVALQMNDTHPALAVAELMRILVDEKALDWDSAWDITRQSLGYTNHTLAPEALERWPLPLFERMLPRHLQLVYEINRRLLAEVKRAHPGDSERLHKMSIVDEAGTRELRMSHLAIAGSHSINGVSALHSELIKSHLAPEFAALWPERFNNKTNGMSQRRWLLLANPGLAELITSRIGEAWITHLTALQELEELAGDAGFRGAFLDVRRQNKVRLARFIRDGLRIDVDVSSLFDVHVKRIHAYKRQLLKVLHIVHEYFTLIEDGVTPSCPRTYIFAGKAAPGYVRAKQIIKLICNVAKVINADPRANNWLKVVFLPDYRVSLAELIIPAADIGEQISTAGTEASGTSNMKLALNGALMVGTRDGANLELLESIGAENAFMFGLEAGEVLALRAPGAYRPERYLEARPELRRVVDSFGSGLFARGDPRFFDWFRQLLLDPGDEHVHLADLSSYLDVQQQVSAAYRDHAQWAARSIRNTARSGQFSSDRTIAEYARDIWQLRPV